MERPHFTALPTARVEARTLALSSHLDPLRCAAELVLRCTAAAWALPAPAELGTLRIASTHENHRHAGIMPGDDTGEVERDFADGDTAARAYRAAQRNDGRAASSDNAGLRQRRTVEVCGAFQRQLRSD